MRLALFTVSYCGLWYKGRALSLEEQIRKAKEMGFDAITIETKRPVAFPIDLDLKTREETKDYAGSLGIELAAVETMSNFASPIIEQRENNLLMVKESIKLAHDLGAPVVKLLVAWQGTIRVNSLGIYPLGSPWHGVEYNPSPTHLQQWNWCVEGIRECAGWAEDYGITLALQNFPPVINYGYEDVLQMVHEIGRDNVGLCLDAPLLYAARQDDDYIREAVQKCKDLIVLSHYGSLYFDETPTGEVVALPVTYLPGKPIVNWPLFIKELKKIGYLGVLSSEECEPVIENHQYAGIEAVDRHVRAALKYMKDLVDKT